LANNENLKKKILLITLKIIKLTPNQELKLSNAKTKVDRKRIFLKLTTNYLKVNFYPDHNEIASKLYNDNIFN